MSSKPAPSQPSSQPHSNGYTFAPELMSPFNFNDGMLFDPAGTSMTSPDRMSQAQQINSALPREVQQAFNDNSIDYYDPGTDGFYYSKLCTAEACTVTQVARSCYCYTSGYDGQVHYVTFDPADALGHSTLNNQVPLPPAAEYLTSAGDTLYNIAQKYGMDLSILLAANPAITNPNYIQANMPINIPAQSYVIQQGDDMYTIAQRFNIPLASFEALNSQLGKPSLIYPGQLLKVPATSLSAPFAYAVTAGNSLYSIAETYKTSLVAVMAVNPQITDPNLIYPGQVVNVPVYMPSQGHVAFPDVAPPARALKISPRFVNAQQKVSVTSGSESAKKSEGLRLPFWKGKQPLSPPRRL